MRSPLHDQVSLSRYEKTKFEGLLQRFGSVPTVDPQNSSLGWRTRLRLAVWSHLVLVAWLLPLGLVAMMTAVRIWWPAGLAGVLLVVVGLMAVAELVRIQHLRRSIRSG